MSKNIWIGNNVQTTPARLLHAILIVSMNGYNVSLIIAIQLFRIFRLLIM